MLLQAKSKARIRGPVNAPREKLKGPITLGSAWQWIPDSQFEKVANVTVIGERKGGSWKLSNGWVVNEFGVAEGGAYSTGGHIRAHQPTV